MLKMAVHISIDIVRLYRKHCWRVGRMSPSVAYHSVRGGQWGIWMLDLAPATGP